MTRAVISGWTGTLFAKIASHTIPLMESYANRYGMAFGCGNLEGERPPSWNKIPLILKSLEQVDEVVWIDSDVVVERGHCNIFDEVPADSWQALVEHETECGTVPNCGIWILRKPMIPILREIWNSFQNIDHPWWEQASVITKMGYDVRHVNAKFTRPTELYERTTFLAQEWNHHPSDIRKVEKPFFRHITSYEDRVGITKKYAAVAEDILRGAVDQVVETTDTLLQVRNGNQRLSKLSQLKVLVQARSNLFNDKGGDTVALKRSCEALSTMGVNLVIDPQGKEDPKQYDLVHLYNFATPKEIEIRARAAKNANVPFVVTTLHEDLDSFFNKMRFYGDVLGKHLFGEYEKIPFADLQIAVQNALVGEEFKLERDNSFAAEHAEALYSSGIQESKLLERDFPYAKKIEVIPFGSHGLPNVTKDLFCNKYEINDYVLCVGRIEWRKNQAMLLKALEDSDIPVALVAGNMTYQPEYQQAVENYKRKGRTLIVANLTNDELASAYRGALVHVLPSWFELPGLVSLEAARCGTPVVGTMYGSLIDYLGRSAIYCDPESLNSIRTSVEQALSKPRGHSGLIERAEHFTWENTAKTLIKSYLSVLGTYRGEDVSGNYRQPIDARF